MPRKNTDFVPVQDLAGNFVMPTPITENISMDIKEIKKRGRPKKYSTAEEARKAKIANTIASAKRRKQLQEGEGILDDLYSGAKNLAGKVKDAVVGKVKSTIKTTKAVLFGRDDYPPKVRDTISKYGDKVITGITLGRTPLGKPLMTALQLASGNTFEEKLKNTPYDKLFHLFICIEFGDGSKILLEKNEVINTENSCRFPAGTETEGISGNIPPGLTLIDALNSTKERMKQKFFSYSARDNNCQDFITAFLQANNLGDPTDISFVKQDTKVLFEGNTRLRKIANTITDIGARFDVIRQGAGTDNIDFEDIKWGSFSKQLKAYNSQHNTNMDLHNFAMMILANPDKFKERTIKRARFYINVILKKGGMLTNFFKDNKRIVKKPLGSDPATWSPTGRAPAPKVEIIEKVGGAVWKGATDPEFLKEYLKKKEAKAGGVITAEDLEKKSPPIKKMANNWIEYVKFYAKKNNMKYNDALKDPKLKAGYKKHKEGGFIFPLLMGAVGSSLIKGLSGRGMPTSQEAFVAENYEQKNLGQHGKVKL